MPISETGTATLGISVARTLRRNRNTTRITSTIEIISVRSTSCTDARIVVVRSSTIVKSIAAGIEAFSEGSAARMRSTVSMMFAPGCRKMISRIAGFPFTKPAARMFSHRIHDVGDVGKLDRRAVVVAHDQRLVIVGLAGADRWR